MMSLRILKHGWDRAKIRRRAAFGRAALFVLIPAVVFSAGEVRAQSAPTPEESPIQGGILPPIVRRGGGSEGDAAAVWQDAIVARVNGVPVLLSEVRDMILSEELSTAVLGAEQLRGPAFQEALARAIDRRLLVQEAYRDDMTVDAAAIATRIDEVIERMIAEAGGRAEFMYQLRRGLMDFDSLRAALIRQETERQLATEVVAKRIVISGRHVDVYVASRQSEGLPTQEVRLAQILVRVKPEHRETAEGRAAYQKALRIAQEVGKDREKFFEVAARESEDAVQRQRGGVLGWVDPDSLVPAMREAVAPLYPGQVTAPVETEQGYHVLMVIDRRSPRDLLFAEKFNEMQIELLERLREQATIEIYDLSA